MDDDGRDSADEETDEEDDEEHKKGDEAAKSKRRSSIRVIGGFDKTVASVVETDQAMEYWPEMEKSNSELARFEKDGFEGGAPRFLRLMSLVTFEGEQVSAALKLPTPQTIPTP